MHKNNIKAVLVSSFIAALLPAASYANNADNELLRLIEAQQEQITRLSDEIAAIKKAELASQIISEKPSKTTVGFHGVLDVSVSNTDSGFGHKTTIGSGGFSASRLGVSLTHKANDYFDVIAKAEAGLFLDTGSVGNSGAVPGTSHAINNNIPSSGGHDGTGSQIFAREAYAGVQGDFGKITIGRQYAGSYLATAITGSAKGEGLYGFSGSIVPRVGGMPTRVNNSMVYLTPKHQGFHVQLLATTGSENNVSNDVVFENGESASNDKAGQGVDAALFYSSEKFNAAVTTWQLKNSSYNTNGETGLATLKGWLLAANYDFGFIKAHATYASGKISGGNYENVTQRLSKSEAWAVSALFPVANKHNFLAAFTDFNDRSNLNQDAKLVGLGYWYNLDASTLLYTTWGKAINNKHASYSLSDGGNLVGRTKGPGVNHSGVMIGMNYRFSR